MNTQPEDDKRPLSLLRDRDIEYIGDLGETGVDQDGNEFLLLSKQNRDPDFQESYEGHNRRTMHETAYPGVSVLFDEETVRAIDWEAVFKER